VKATLMLADSAQVAEGKLFILGGGWSITSGALPSALAIKIEVPWNDANRPHTMTIRLLDSDGNEVLDLANETFEVGRPAGIPTGTAIDHLLAIQMGPLTMLEHGQRYVWELSIDGNVSDDWRCAFYVRPAPQPAPVEQ
jgi:hypothetical protein